MKNMGVKLGIILACLVLPLAYAAAQDDEGLALVNFVVLKDHNGQPIRNASVVLHPVNKHGKQERGGLQLKTNPDGKASYDGVPYGKLRIQVLATGFQTFGEDYDITQPSMEITVKMKRPAGQYSIYENHPEEKKDDKKDEKKDAPPAPENKDQNKDQPK